jgi:hypothetical protein
MRSPGMDRIDATMKTRKIETAKAVDRGYLRPEATVLEPEGGTRWPSGRDVDRRQAARAAFIFRVNSAGLMGPMLGNGCGLPALISGDLGGRRAGMMDGPTCAPGNRIQDGLR